jgi:hypothetical protein
MIHPQFDWSVKCLQAGNDGATSAAAFDIANSAVTQRWLIMTADQMNTMANYALIQMKQSVKDELALVKALTAVPHVERTAGVDASLQGVVSTVESQLPTAGDVSEVSAMLTSLENAATAFLNGVNATDMSKPFDLTFMLVNPTVDSNTDGWSEAATVSFQCAEFYEKNFNFNQKIGNLPAGTYAFCAQAFQRPGPYGSSAGVSVNAVIYAGSNTARLAHITRDAQTSKVGVGREQTMNGKYVPDNMEAASAYFEKGLYENKVLTTVAKKGAQLQFGIRCPSMGSKYWVIFDNFRLYFYGGVSIDDVTAIKGVSSVPAATDNTYYDLQGRRVENPGRGLYILNGKKVIIR